MLELTIIVNFCDYHHTLIDNVLKQIWPSSEMHTFLTAITFTFIWWWAVFDSQFFIISRTIGETSLYRIIRSGDRQVGRNDAYFNVKLKIKIILFEGQ